MTRVLNRGGFTTITLNRPQQRNALNEEVIRRLAEATNEVANDPDCRCLVIKGQGDHFCAGRDLGEADNPRPSVNLSSFNFPTSPTDGGGFRLSMAPSDDRWVRAAGG